MELEDYPRAVQAYETAAEWYRGEDSNAYVLSILILFSPRLKFPSCSNNFPSSSDALTRMLAISLFHLMLTISLFHLILTISSLYNDYNYPPSLITFPLSIMIAYQSSKRLPPKGGDSGIPTHTSLRHGHCTVRVGSPSQSRQQLDEVERARVPVEGWSVYPVHR